MNTEEYVDAMTVLLSYAPPGWEDCHLSAEADIAEVDWFAEEVPAAGIDEGLSTSCTALCSKGSSKMIPLATFGCWRSWRLASLQHSLLSCRQLGCLEPLCLFHAADPRGGQRAPSSL